MVVVALVEEVMVAVIEGVVVPVLAVRAVLLEVRLLAAGVTAVQVVWVAMAAAVGGEAMLEE